jgi:hypothetical protein
VPVHSAVMRAKTIQRALFMGFFRSQSVSEIQDVTRSCGGSAQPGV